MKHSHGIVGKKGVLWWEIYRILEKKGDHAPDYLMLENVDRLLKSPSKQRGRDFAIILSSLNSLGYPVEWRVVTASEYGMPQRRKRTFIMGYRKGSAIYERMKNDRPQDIMNDTGVFAKAFPVQRINTSDIMLKILSDDLVDITENFNIKTPKVNAFHEAGYMIDDVYHTAKCTPDYTGPFMTLRDILIDEDQVPAEFYIDDEELERWQYQKEGFFLKKCG